MSSKRSRHCLLLRVRRCGATTESLVPELSHTSQNVRMRGFVPPFFFCTPPPTIIQRERDGSDVTNVALKLAMNLHFPLPKTRTIGDELTLSLAKNSHFSFLPSHFPSLPSRRGHHCGAEIRIEVILSIQCQNFFSPPLFPPLSNGTSRATSDRKPKTNDQILPSPILLFPSKK